MEHFLGEALAEQLKAGDVAMDFLVQVQADPATMPVEDSLVLWDEEKAPFRKVATLRIPKQDLGDDRGRALGETLAFTPWHSLPEHRPLGSINRARRAIYEAVSEFRRSRNEDPRTEPTELPR